MKFGGRQTLTDKMAVADALLGKHTGASKGSSPAPKAKVKPTGNPLKGKVGVKITKKF